MPGLPFTPVEFDGISVTPYVNGNGRLAYSIKVREMHAPHQTTARPRPERTPPDDPSPYPAHQRDPADHRPRRPHPQPPVLPP